MPYRNYSQNSIGGNVQHRNPIGMDLTPIATAIQTINNNALKVAEQKGAIAAAINKLPLNVKEDAWKANYINNIQKQIDASAQTGDYATAVETATRLANEAVFSPEVMGRLRANQQFEDTKKQNLDRLRSGKISQNTYDWWLRANPYQYEDTYDDNGTIVGGTEYNSKPLYDDIQIPSLAKMAFDLATPEKTDVRRAGSSSITNASNVNQTVNGKTYNAGTGISGQSDRRFQQQKVDIQTIRDNMEELIKTLPDGWNQVEQAYDVAIDSFTRLVNEYNDAVTEDPNSSKTAQLAEKLEIRKKLFYQNGSPVSYNEWFARTLTYNLLAENMAYDWTVDHYESGSANTISGVSYNTPTHEYSNTPKPGYTFDYSVGKWKSPNVVMETDNSLNQREVSASQANINNRCK